MTTFGKYSLELWKFDNYPKSKEGVFHYSITHVDGRPITDEEIGEFLYSYIDDMGKWEKILNTKKDLIRIGKELLQGFDISIPYTSEQFKIYEEDYSIYRINKTESPNCKIAEIKVSYRKEIDETDFEYRLENVDKWRLLIRSVTELKEVIKSL